MALKQMGVSIDEQLQKEFKDVIKGKYNRVKGIYGLEIEKALKIYLAILGNDSYCDDPEVKQMLECLGEKLSSTHTYS